MTSPAYARGRIAAFVVAGILIGFAVYRLVAPDESKVSPCEAPVAERIDPLSSQHLLPGAAEPAYLSDPPTSGAHSPGTHPTGALTARIERPVQVSLLEEGHVLVQYRNVSSSTVPKLAALAGDHVTVAPNRALPARIVATAWLHKMSCNRIDEDALRAFITEYRQKVSAH